MELIQIKWPGKTVLHRNMKPGIKLHEYLGEEYITVNSTCKGPVVGKEFYWRNCKKDRAELLKKHILSKKLGQEIGKGQIILYSFAVGTWVV